MHAPRWVIVVGALLAAGRVRAGLPEPRFPFPEMNIAAQRAMLQQARPAPGPYAAGLGTMGAPVASIPLAPVLDRVRTAKTEFRAGTAEVHVFGGKSRNKKNWFVGFATDGGDTQFRNGRKMIHWALLNRTVRLELGGRRYSAHVDGKVTDKMHSVLVVEAEDKAEPKRSWTVEQLADAAYETGVPVTISGKEYRLMYTRDFDEDGDGEFAGYAADRSITLMTREGGKLIGYHWFEREIPRDAILVSKPKAVGADESKDGAFVVGLRVTPAGTLELYSPAGAGVAAN